MGVRIGPTQARFAFGSLRAYIAAAFGVRDHQIAGPGWLATEVFDIVAKMPENGASASQVPAMLRTLLEERFRLRTHRESRQLPAYALELATGRPPLVRLPDEAPPPGPFTAESGPVGGGRVTTLGDGSRFTIDASRFEATRVTMKSLADVLAPFVDRPILDMTGLEGLRQADTAVAVAVPEALERAGLKLRPLRAPVDMLVIDSIDRTPTEN